MFQFLPFFLFPDYFQSDGKDTFSLEELQITLECLQHDADRDVKYFAGGEIVDTPRFVCVLICLCLYAYIDYHHSNNLSCFVFKSYHHVSDLISLFITHLTD